MAKIPAFGPWSEKDHIGTKQENAIKAAQKEETTPQAGSVDKDRQTAVFWGSGSEPYQTTLASCTCGAFRGKAPCKHIYRLAMELGIIEAQYDTGISKGERIQTQLQWEDAVAEFEKLTPEARRTAYYMLRFEKVGRHDLHLVDKPEIIAELRTCPLIEEHPAEDEILSHMKRDALYEVAAKSGVSNLPKKNAAAAVIAKWLKENVPNLDELLPKRAAFAFIPQFDRAQPSVMKHYNGTM